MVVYEPLEGTANMTYIPVDKLPKEKGIDYSRTHLARLIKAGGFPKPVFLSPRKRAFVESEIDAWLEARAGKRAEEMAA